MTPTTSHLLRRLLSASFLDGGQCVSSQDRALPFWVSVKRRETFLGRLLVGREELRHPVLLAPLHRLPDTAVRIVHLLLLAGPDNRELSVLAPALPPQSVFTLFSPGQLRQIIMLIVSLVWWLTSP